MSGVMVDVYAEGAPCRFLMVSFYGDRSTTVHTGTASIESLYELLSFAINGKN